MWAECVYVFVTGKKPGTEEWRPSRDQATGL